MHRISFFVGWVQHSETHHFRRTVFALRWPDSVNRRVRAHTPQDEKREPQCASTRAETRGD